MEVAGSSGGSARESPCGVAIPPGDCSADPGRRPLLDAIEFLQMGPQVMLAAEVGVGKELPIEEAVVAVGQGLEGASRPTLRK